MQFNNDMGWDSAYTKSSVKGLGLGTFQTTNAQKLAKKIRNLAKDYPEIAAQAIKEAAEETFVPALQNAMENGGPNGQAGANRKYGRFTHNWKGDLTASIGAEIVGKGKFPSIRVGFDDSVEYAGQFLAGGMHGDYEDIPRLTQWLMDKDKITKKEARYAAKLIRMHLRRFGQEPYQYIIFEPVYEETYPKFNVAHRVRLYELMDSILSPGGSVPF